MKLFSLMNQSLFSHEKKTVVLSLVFGLEGIFLLFVVAGCYQLPRSIPYWHGGMNEMPLEQNSYQEEWNQSYNSSHQSNNHSAVPQSSSKNQTHQKDSTGSYNDKSYNNINKQNNNLNGYNKNGDSKISFRFFRKIFGQGSPIKSNDRPVAKNSDELFADNRFYPADFDQISFDYSGQKSNKNKANFISESDFNEPNSSSILSENLLSNSKSVELSPEMKMSDSELATNIQSKSSVSPVNIIDSNQSDQHLVSANQATVDSSLETTASQQADVVQKEELSRPNINQIYYCQNLNEVLAQVEANQLPDAQPTRSICNFMLDYNQKLNISPTKQMIANHFATPDETVLPVRFQTQSENDDSVKSLLFEQSLFNQENLESNPNQTNQNASDKSQNNETELPSWEKQTQRAIESLEKKIKDQQQQGIATTKDEMKLQILRLSLGESNSVQAESIETDPVKKFWTHQVNGISSLLNQSSDLNADSNATTYIASELQKGLDSLTQICPIQIRKAILVEKAAQFGLYQKKIGCYQPGTKVYVYAELEYVQNKETAQGHEMCAVCSWELVDVNGKIILPKTEQSCSSTSESRLRDIVLNISIDLPQNLNVGTYHLVFSVLDKNNPTQPSTSKEIQLQVIR